MIERCEQCGFDGSAWSDTAALARIAELPRLWTDAVGGLNAQQLQRRPLPRTWSVAEYADHVREVLFGMRFILDTALAHPGSDLGDAPEPRFDPEPRIVEIDMALAGIEREANELHRRLSETAPTSWDSTVILSGDEVDLHWIARHAVHDATHHLADVELLRRSL